MRRSDLESFQIAEQGLITFEAQAHLLGRFCLAWRSAEPRSQDSNRLLGRPSLATKVSRTPVQRAQAVQNSASDSKLRVAPKLHLLPRIELGEGVHQADNAGR